jgi:rhamnosyl/mannosyltransferase
VNEHKVSGLNVDPKDAKQLAESIMAIAEDEDAYKVFCEGAEQRYRDLFTKEKMIGNLQEIYSELWKK